MESIKVSVDFIFCEKQIKKGGTPSMSKKEIVTVDFIDTLVPFVDEDDNEFDMEIVEVFDYNGTRFALLAEPHEHDEEETCDCEEENLYIFEVHDDEDGTEYVAVEDETLLDELIVAIEQSDLFGADE